MNLFILFTGLLCLVVSADLATIPEAKTILSPVSTTADKKIDKRSLGLEHYGSIHGSEIGTHSHTSIHGPEIETHSHSHGWNEGRVIHQEHPWKQESVGWQPEATGWHQHDEPKTVTKTITLTKNHHVPYPVKVPVHVVVEKKVPYPVEVPVHVPHTVTVEKPVHVIKPVVVEKKVPERVIVERRVPVIVERERRRRVQRVRTVPRSNRVRTVALRDPRLRIVGNRGLGGGIILDGRFLGAQNILGDPILGGGIIGGGILDSRFLDPDFFGGRFLGGGGIIIDDIFNRDPILEEEIIDDGFGDFEDDEEDIDDIL